MAEKDKNGNYIINNGQDLANAVQEMIRVERGSDFNEVKEFAAKHAEHAHGAYYASGMEFKQFLIDFDNPLETMKNLKSSHHMYSAGLEGEEMDVRFNRMEDMFVDVTNLGRVAQFERQKLEAMTPEERQSEMQEDLTATETSTIASIASDSTQVGENATSMDNAYAKMISNVSNPTDKDNLDKAYNELKGQTDALKNGEINPMGYLNASDNFRDAMTASTKNIDPTKSQYDFQDQGIKIINEAEEINQSARDALNKGDNPKDKGAQIDSAQEELMALIPDSVRNAMAGVSTENSGLSASNIAAAGQARQV